MANQIDFNQSPSYRMHIDLNSCFATIEQQANPLLRGKPIAVAAYASPGGCILAPSIEAKTFGIKTGMRVFEGKKLYPKLIVLPPDPWKYRQVHLALRKILSAYTPNFHPKSIDEFALNLKGMPALKSMTMFDIANKIKKRIKNEIGEWLTVSVGIAPNRFLAKTAAGLHKPDGLDEINHKNFWQVYSTLSLPDLCGIASHNTIRLSSIGIYTVQDFYQASIRTLKIAFSSIAGYYWYLRLRGYEIDDMEFARRSYGNSYALPAGRQAFQTSKELAPILAKLTHKATTRLRAAGYKATGVHLARSYRDGSFWHEARTAEKILYDTRDFYKLAARLLLRSPSKPTRELAVSCFGIIKDSPLQLDLFSDEVKKASLVESIDKANTRWGHYTLTQARMIDTSTAVPDRIAFGGVKELEEFLQ